MYVSLKLSKRAVFSTMAIIIFVIITAINVFGEKENNEESYIEVPIVMYHGILKDRKCQGKYIVSSKTFERDLKYLNDNGYTTIFMTDLINYIYEDTILPEKPIILTFDDGYYNNYLYAFDLVKKYNCKMVLSPIGKCVDQYSEIEDKNPNYAHCNWDELKEMVSSGCVEIQNHSYNLHSSTSSGLGSNKKRGENKTVYKKRFTDDIIKMQEKMEDNIGFVPNTFTYPFGAKCAYSEELVKELGFKASLDCEEKVNKIYKKTDSLYSLHRFLRPPGSSSEEFFRKIVNN